ncbi:MAG: hypothetical protein WCO11_07440 [Sphingomonadales bacterium]|jgi:hypothetical protein
MNPFEMVVMIVAIVTVGPVLSGRMGGRRIRLRGLDTAPPADSADNQRLQAEVARLNERIRVLERLATDPAKRLSDEIEQLKND